MYKLYTFLPSRVRSCLRTLPQILPSVAYIPCTSEWQPAWLSILFIMSFSSNVLHFSYTCLHFPCSPRWAINLSLGSDQTIPRWRKNNPPMEKKLSLGPVFSASGENLSRSLGLTIPRCRQKCRQSDGKYPLPARSNSLYISKKIIMQWHYAGKCEIKINDARTRAYAYILYRGYTWRD